MEIVPDRWDKIPEPEEHLVIVMDLIRRAIQKGRAAEWVEDLALEEAGELAEAGVSAGAGTLAALILNSYLVIHG